MKDLYYLWNIHEKMDKFDRDIMAAKKRPEAKDEVIKYITKSIRTCEIREAMAKGPYQYGDTTITFALRRLMEMKMIRSPKRGRYEPIH